MRKKKKRNNSPRKNFACSKRAIAVAIRRSFAHRS
jgi:hypothetical protein